MFLIIFNQRKCACVGINNLVIFNSSSNTEKLSVARKESIIVPIYKKNDRTNCI